MKSLRTIKDSKFPSNMYKESHFILVCSLNRFFNIRERCRKLIKNLCFAVVECACLVSSGGYGKQIAYKYRHCINRTHSQSFWHTSMLAFAVVRVTRLKTQRPTLLRGLRLGLSRKRMRFPSQWTMQFKLSWRWMFPPRDIPSTCVLTASVRNSTSEVLEKHK